MCPPLCPATPEAVHVSTSGAVTNHEPGMKTVDVPGEYAPNLATTDAVPVSSLVPVSSHVPVSTPIPTPGVVTH